MATTSCRSPPESTRSSRLAYCAAAGRIETSSPSPIRHVHPERADTGDDALGDYARGRPIVAMHAVLRGVGDEPLRLIEAKQHAAAADLLLVGGRVVGVGDEVHAVAHR